MCEALESLARLIAASSSSPDGSVDLQRVASLSMWNHREIVRCLAFLAGESDNAFEQALPVWEHRRDRIEQLTKRFGELHERLPDDPASVAVALDRALNATEDLLK